MGSVKSVGVKYGAPNLCWTWIKYLIATRWLWPKVTSHIEPMLSMVQAKLQKPSVPQNNKCWTWVVSNWLPLSVFTGVGTEGLFKYYCEGDWKVLRALSTVLLSKPSALVVKIFCPINSSKQVTVNTSWKSTWEIFKARVREGFLTLTSLSVAGSFPRTDRPMWIFSS